MRGVHVLARLVVVPVFGILALPACAAEAEDVEEDSANVTDEATSKLALDVNDVSVLFPVTPKGPAPSIEMTAANGLDLFPQSVMTDIATFQSKPEPDKDRNLGPDNHSQGAVTSLSGEEAGASRDKWRIVSFRFDPCTEPVPNWVDGARQLVGKNPFPTFKIKNIKSQGDCEVQIRLIAQPFSELGDEDTSAHLVFSFGKVGELFGGGKKARDRIVGKLQALKSKSPRPTNGVPLGVHPGLAEDPKGAFAGLVKTFLLEELAQAELTAVASMGTANGDPWVFAHGEVKNGHWEVAPITGYGIDLGITDILSGPRPRATSQHDVAGFQIRPAAIPKAGENHFIATTTELFGEGKGDINLAHQVNNPNIAGLFNTDCVSCHTATERTINKRDLAPGADRFKVPKGVTGYVEKKDTNTNLPKDEAGEASPAIPTAENRSEYNFRNFGYFFGQATVSHRTLNETSVVVDHINRDLLGKEEGPGQKCTDDAKVWTCFRDGKSAAECFTKANGCEPLASEDKPRE
jgi:hypothetical protein